MQSLCKDLVINNEKKQEKIKACRLKTLGSKNIKKTLSRLERETTKTDSSSDIQKYDFSEDSHQFTATSNNDSDVV